MLEPLVAAPSLALAASHAQLLRAERISHSGSWELDIASNQVTWSDGLFLLYQLTPGQIEPSYAAFMERVHPDDRAYVQQRVTAARQQPGPFEYESRIVLLDGQVRHVRTQGEFLADGAAAGRLVGVTADITKHKRLEEALRETEERFTKAFHLSPVALSITRLTDGQFVEVNEYFLSMLGYAQEEVIGQTSMGLNMYLPDERAALIEHIRRQGGVRDYEMKLRTKTGELRDVRISNIGIELTHEQHILAILADITDRERADVAIQRVTADLQRSNSELEQFAYVASHDLQEPLRMVASYVQLLARRYQGKLDADADEFIQYAVEGAARMQQLINDLLAYSRVGTRVKPPAPASLEAALAKALDNLQIAVQESGAVITHAALPSVVGDESQLVQLFQNLISNAIKFHQAAPPAVEISVISRAREWEFRVRDNGIGLDPQFAERIFVIFQRLHTRAEYAGTGIGLAICKKIVERHGGRIWVESAPGQGTTFYFTLAHQGAAPNGQN